MNGAPVLRDTSRTLILSLLCGDRIQKGARLLSKEPIKGN